MAETKVQELKAEVEELEQKLNKSPEQKKALGKLYKQLRHWQKKAAETGETHWRREK